MINFGLFFIFLFLTSLLFALLEVQIEGANGWAKKLPTWRIKAISIDGKHLTGYHVYAFTFIFLILHMPFVFLPWSLKFELYILSFYFWFSSLEDILWFVVNPNYGIKRFLKQDVGWHNSWIFGLPQILWLFIILGSIFFYWAFSL